jgi:hypothetical protein
VVLFSVKLISMIGMLLVRLDGSGRIGMSQDLGAFERKGICMFLADLEIETLEVFVFLYMIETLGVLLSAMRTSRRRCSSFGGGLGKPPGSLGLFLSEILIITAVFIEFDGCGKEFFFFFKKI